MTQKPNPTNKIWQAGFDDGAKGARAKSKLPTYLAGHKAGSDAARDAKTIADERLNPTPPAPKISAPSAVSEPTPQPKPRHPRPGGHKARRAQIIAQTDPTSPSSTPVTPKSPRNATPESDAPKTSRKHAKPQKPKRFAAHFIAPRGRGQPTKYNDSLASTILRLMTTGMSLKRICDQPGMPCADSVYYWQAIHPDFSVRYARAMLDRAQFWAEEILDISDDGSNDWVEQQRNGKTVMVGDHEHIQRSRLRVDTRKFLMAKLDPKRWGDKIQVSGDADNPLQISVRDLAKEQHALSPPELAALQAFAEARRNATEIESVNAGSTDASESD
jgi:hypothetical protein